jgi:hypothetical protein
MLKLATCKAIKALCVSLAVFLGSMSPPCLCLQETEAAPAKLRCEPWIARASRVAHQPARIFVCST